MRNSFEFVKGPVSGFKRTCGSRSRMADRQKGALKFEKGFMRDFFESTEIEKEEINGCGFEMSTEYRVSVALTWLGQVESYIRLIKVCPEYMGYPRFRGGWLTGYMAQSMF